MALMLCLAVLLVSGCGNSEGEKVKPLDFSISEEDYPTRGDDFNFIHLAYDNPETGPELEFGFEGPWDFTQLPAGEIVGFEYMKPDEIADSKIPDADIVVRITRENETTYRYESVKDRVEVRALEIRWDDNGGGVVIENDPPYVSVVFPLGILTSWQGELIVKYDGAEEMDISYNADAVSIGKLMLPDVEFDEAIMIKVSESRVFMGNTEMSELITRYMWYAADHGLVLSVESFPEDRDVFFKKARQVRYLTEK